MKKEMQGRKQSVGDGVEVLVPDGREVNEIDATVRRLGMPLSPVHDNLMAAFDEAARKLFGERLKPTVAGGNAARAD